MREILELIYQTFLSHVTTPKGSFLQNLTKKDGKSDI